MSTLRERLALALAKKRGGSQAELARACGVSSASVADWFSGQTKTLKAGSLLAAARYLKVRPEWLQTGVGAMHPDQDSATEVLAREPDPPWADWPFSKLTPSQWRALTAEQRAQIEGFALGIAMSSLAGTPPRMDGTTGLPGS